MPTPTHLLPPNPYTRKPITKSERLGGRNSEIEKVQYYLRLTATADSPHIALLGPRGVGKTSLLNAIEGLAPKIGLAVIRIDLDEHKTSAPGVFWQNFFASLLLVAGDLGCWGGTQGVIYARLFQMIHARKLPDPADIVLQFPAVLATNEGPLENLSCPDALIQRDLVTIGREFRARGCSGVAVLVDEADCLNQNRTLIQTLRNVFQRLEAWSIVLAGTEAVFPTLTDVFSPIPRQFHKIEVRPFRQTFQTVDLVTKAFKAVPYSEHKDVLPVHSTIESLHELCGGDPSELQLYCHHMYRLVEHKVVPRMDLVPAVFREVIREYRTFAPADLSEVMIRVQQLPDSLLFESRWLRRLGLTTEESIEASVVEAELVDGRQRTPEDIALIRRDIEAGYDALHRAGLTTEPNRLELVGGEFIASFWKSYVTAEKGEQWSWIKATLGETLIGLVLRGMLMGTNAGSDMPIVEGNDGISRLNDLRTGQQPIQCRPVEVVELMVAREVLDDEESENGGEATVAIHHGGDTERWRLSYADKSSAEAILESLQDWLSLRGDILELHRLRVTVESARTYTRPTNAEMQHLAFISGIALPKETFGQSIPEVAYNLFKTGDTEGAIERFRWMMDTDPSDLLANNLAYCYMMLGRYEEARGMFEKMRFLPSDENWPIWQHNRALLAFVTGDRAAAQQMLRQALEWVRTAGSNFDPKNVLCMFLLEDSGQRLASVDGLPIDAAILLNSLAIGPLGDADAVHELSRLYPAEASQWLSRTRSSESSQQ